jgi:Uma2 family endonuclease
MSAVSTLTISPAEYLAFERAAPVRHEYFQGRMYAMAGASPAHEAIVSNVLRHAGNALDGGPCFPYGSNLRVKCPTGLYSYPDVSIVCGPLEFDDHRKDTITNPAVLIEVLSPSTETYDREDKFKNYRSLESLREYVLIAQDRCHIEVFRRKSPLSIWEWSDYSDLTETLRLETSNLAVLLSAIYAHVTFPSAEPSTDGTPATLNGT